MNKELNYLAGGVNSPIPIPQFYPSSVVAGSGPYVHDIKGRRFVDLWMGYGALLFGHRDEATAAAVKRSLKSGWFFSYPTLVEKEVSVLLHDHVPCAENVRFATTGSDAVAYAIRAARSFTRRDKVLAIKGGYHGVHEGLIPSSGVSRKQSVDRVAFNDAEQAALFLKKKEYACIILEPIMANSGCVPATKEYLRALRRLCTQTGTVLIFDEVVTGFRIALGGAQQYYKVTPDLCVFSKAIAGGFPLSAVCGKAEILGEYIPKGEVFFAGTFNGVPSSLFAAKAVIGRLKDGAYHKEAFRLGDEIRAHIKDCIKESRLRACVQGIGSMFTIAFGCDSFRAGIQAEKFSPEKYGDFILEMAKRGYLFPPLPTETVFLSPVHARVKDNFKKTLREVLKSLA